MILPIQLPSARSEPNLTESCVEWLRTRIVDGAYAPGARLPSIRAFARQHKVSPFTAAEAYARLVASGLVDARRGSGMFVSRPAARPAALASDERQSPIDLVWLLRGMLADGEEARGPGTGILPRSWFDGTGIGAALRGLGRQGGLQWLANGTPHGFAPLRNLLQRRLADLGVDAAPDQIVLTTGITHAIHLVVRRLLRPGDTVLVGDPSWFGALGLLASSGIRMVSVPFTVDGPDLSTLERLATTEAPKLLILNSIAHNPTGVSLSPEAVTRIIELSRRHDFLIFEDDVYADLCGPEASRSRLASVDQLDRVIYAGSFSKTLAANIRVGFLATGRALAAELADSKLLTGFTTPELNERLVHRLLVEGRYRAHTERLRERLADQRAQAIAWIERRGLRPFTRPDEGLFLWIDMQASAEVLADSGRRSKLVVAPGTLFSPTQAASTWMRFNVTTARDALLDRFFDSVRAGPSQGSGN